MKHSLEMPIAMPVADECMDVQMDVRTDGYTDGTEIIGPLSALHGVQHLVEDF